jgi:hypothetical protein
MKLYWSISLKPMPWHRPEGSKMPNRQGDRDETPIYTALGKAVSAWEGVNAAISQLFYAFNLSDRVEAFGGLHKVHDRAKELRQEIDRFLDADFGEKHDEAAKLKKSMKKALGAYVEWASRRNELAHGYVTQASSPDYKDENQPVITVYALLPSHARLERWRNAEPEFNYLASEIDMFAYRFRELDSRIERIADAVKILSASRVPKIAGSCKDNASNI